MDAKTTTHGLSHWNLGQSFPLNFTPRYGNHSNTVRTPSNGPKLPAGTYDAKRPQNSSFHWYQPWTKAASIQMNVSSIQKSTNHSLWTRSSSFLRPISFHWTSPQQWEFPTVEGCLRCFWDFSAASLQRVHINLFISVTKFYMKIHKSKFEQK